MKKSTQKTERAQTGALRFLQMRQILIAPESVSLMIF